MSVIELHEKALTQHEQLRLIEIAHESQCYEVRGFALALLRRSQEPCRVIAFDGPRMPAQDYTA